MHLKILSVDLTVPVVTTASPDRLWLVRMQECNRLNDY